MNCPINNFEKSTYASKVETINIMKQYFLLKTNTPLDTSFIGLTDDYKTSSSSSYNFGPLMNF